ncbi:hypothetical protein NFI96_007874 [Prochilodus magdalenae]|nr:hypothetical protein NFI96_007874 [Prochilodus magdalenae]
MDYRSRTCTPTACPVRSVELAKDNECQIDGSRFLSHVSPAHRDPGGCVHGLGCPFRWLPASHCCPRGAALHQHRSPDEAEAWRSKAGQSCRTVLQECERDAYSPASERV